MDYTLLIIYFTIQIFIVDSRGIPKESQRELLNVWVCAFQDKQKLILFNKKQTRDILTDINYIFKLFWGYKKRFILKSG